MRTKSKRSSIGIQKQPMSKGTKEEPIYKMVIRDIRARAKVGKKTYGVYLQASNGRDALVDLYHELLDACKYLRQEIERRNRRKKRRKKAP